MTITFDEYQYVRPDIEEMKKDLMQLVTKFKEASTVEEHEQVLD